MSTVKTKIDQDIVLSHLKENFEDSVNNFQFITGGEMSQAFSFDAKDGSFIIRVNSSERSFRKDAYAYENFAASNIPIPEILKIGKLNETLYFCISRKAEGKIIDNLTEEEYQETFPDLLRVMDAIHAVGVKESFGYGKWSPDGTAKFGSWKEFILMVNEFPDKEHLFETSFLEKDMWENIAGHIKKLSVFCPEERFLVHGDYGHNNATSDGKKITGIFDWDGSMYGDFVYDVAWLSFWLTKPERIMGIESHYAKMHLPHYAERLLCYKLRIGLSSLSFYAYSNQKNKYDSIKQRTLDLISER